MFDLNEEPLQLLDAGPSTTAAAGSMAVPLRPAPVMGRGMFNLVQRNGDENAGTGGWLGDSREDVEQIPSPRWLSPTSNWAPEGLASWHKPEQRQSLFSRFLKGWSSDGKGSSVPVAEAGEKIVGKANGNICIETTDFIGVKLEEGHAAHRQNEAGSSSSSVACEEVGKPWDFLELNLETSRPAPSVDAELSLSRKEHSVGSVGLGSDLLFPGNLKRSREVSLQEFATKDLFETRKSIRISHELSMNGQCDGSGLGISMQNLVDRPIIEVQTKSMLFSTTLEDAEKCKRESPDLGLQQKPLTTLYGSSPANGGLPDASERQMQPYDSRFGHVCWKGQIRLENEAANNLVAFCSRELQEVLKNVGLPSTLVVDKVVPVQTFMEIFNRQLMQLVMRVVLTPGASPSDAKAFSSMVQSLYGVAADLLLGIHHKPLSTPVVPSIGVVPIYDEKGKHFIGDLYLAPLSLVASLDTVSGELGIGQYDGSTIVAFLHACTDTTLFGCKIAREQKGNLASALPIRLVTDIESKVANGIPPIVGTANSKSSGSSISGGKLTGSIGETQVPQSKHSCADDISSEERQELEEGQLLCNLSSEEQDPKEEVRPYATKCREQTKQFPMEEKKERKTFARVRSLKEDDMRRERLRERERERDRERDRDRRGRERDVVLSRSRSSREIYGHLYRADSKVLLRGDKDREAERFRERERDFQWDIGERVRNNRDRAKEQDRDRSRERERERERDKEREKDRLEKVLRLQERLGETGKEKPDSRKLLENDKGRHIQKPEDANQVQLVTSKSTKRREREVETEAMLNVKRMKENKEAILDGKPIKTNHELQKLECIIPDVAAKKGAKELSQQSTNTNCGDTLRTPTSVRIQVKLEPNVEPIIVQESSQIKCEVMGSTNAMLMDKEAQSEPNDLALANVNENLPTTTVPSTCTEAGPAFQSRLGANEAYYDLLLDSCDRDTRVCLFSRQTSEYLQEEYGVILLKQEETSSPKAETKTDHQLGSVHIKLALEFNDACDAAEAKFFLQQAADVVKAIASHGVYTKCIWYQGPVQRFAGEVAPSVNAVVRKIKGEDGKNLERVQDCTGVVIGVVQDPHSKKAMAGAAACDSPVARTIGLRLKSVRRKALAEASKQVHHLLSTVSDYFIEEMKVPSTDIQVYDQTETKLSIPKGSSQNVTNLESESMHDISSDTNKVMCLPPAPPYEGAFNAGPAIWDNGSVAPVHPEKNDPPLCETSHMGDNEADKSGQADMDHGLSRILYVSNLPEYASVRMLRGIFGNVLKEKLKEDVGVPPGFENSSDIVIDVRYIPERFCAFVEFATDDLLTAALQLYKQDNSVFYGLSVQLAPDKDGQLGKVELGLKPTAAEIETNLLARSSSVRKSKTEVSNRHVLGADSDYEYVAESTRIYNDGTSKSGDKPKPLFVTELMRNATAASIKQLFEEIIRKHAATSMVNNAGKQLVLDVRHIPSRGCVFVDLASPDLVDFMLDLHGQRPDIFHNMKMELGRRHMPGLCEELDKKIMQRNPSFLERSRSSRNMYNNRTPRRRGDDKDLGYEDFEEEDGRPIKKPRSDPEKTVYADRLPDNASEGMIRRIFERVLHDHMPPEMRAILGDDVVTEVRHVPIKFCAFIVFVAEDLTRLVLQLYNQNEEIFDHMRLKPHFHSRMEDFYREEINDRGDDDTRSIRDASLERKGSQNGNDDYLGNEVYDGFGRPSAHRAVAATGFKEVDRRRSVYVDRIPEKLPEPAVREIIDKVFRRKYRNCSTHPVSQVTFFRDKFDPNKLCAFVEVKNEDVVQDLLDCYASDEDAFAGMRLRPAFKYS